MLKEIKLIITVIKIEIINGGRVFKYQEGIGHNYETSISRAIDHVMLNMGWRYHIEKLWL